MRAKGGSNSTTDPRNFRVAQLKNGSWHRLNMAELAQIQGFDAPLQFPTHWQANKQQELIGNAVPPPVARAVLLQVRVFLHTCFAL